MAENISDEKFKAEVLRFIGIANQKFDGLTTDIRSANFRLDKVENGFELMGEKVDILTGVIRELSGSVRSMSGQVSSVIPKVIDHEERLISVESRVTMLEAETH